MRRFRPIHGILFVAVFVGLVWVGDAVIGGGTGYGEYTLINPDAAGTVRIGTGDLEAGEVRFYRFLNRGNQEVKFFVGRDEERAVEVGFDANEICFKRKRGFKYQEGWLVCRVCDKSFRLSEVNAGGGGCKPLPLAHHLEGDQVVLTEADILQGWRYFR